jgi:hypothetical protein
MKIIFISSFCNVLYDAILTLMYLLTQSMAFLILPIKADDSFSYIFDSPIDMMNEFLVLFFFYLKIRHLFRGWKLGMGGFFFVDWSWVLF